jgi:hypothetical protein
MNNLLSYCGLVDARISFSEKDLPVRIVEFFRKGYKITYFAFLKCLKIIKINETCYNFRKIASIASKRKTIKEKHRRPVDLLTVIGDCCWRVLDR